MPTPDPYDIDANPDFLSALVAYWLATPALVVISAAPYADQAPAGVPEDGPYVVLVQANSVANGHATGMGGRPAWDEYTYRFSLYHKDQDEAARLGGVMAGLLDAIGDRRLAFGDGYQMLWSRAGSRLMEVPTNAGARTIWQQNYDYRAWVGR